MSIETQIDNAHRPGCADCGSRIRGGAIERCRCCGRPICARCSLTGPGWECRECAEAEHDELSDLGRVLLARLAQAGRLDTHRETLRHELAEGPACDACVEGVA